MRKAGFEPMPVTLRLWVQAFCLLKSNSVACRLHFLGLIQRSRQFCMAAPRSKSAKLYLHRESSCVIDHMPSFKQSFEEAGQQ